MSFVSVHAANKTAAQTHKYAFIISTQNATPPNDTATPNIRKAVSVSKNNPAAPAPAARISAGSDFKNSR